MFDPIKYKTADLSIKAIKGNFLSSNEKLISKSIFNSVSEGIAYTDIEGLIISCNKSLLIIHGYESLEEIKGINLVDLIDPLDREKAKRNISILSEEKGSLNKIKYNCLRKNGESFSAEISTSLINDENRIPIGFLSVINDISEIESANKQLELLVTALESAANEVVITDNLGEVIWVNSAFNKTTGYSDNEIIGGNPRILKSGIHPEEFYEKIWETITSGKVWNGEISNKKKNGEIFTEEMTITPLIGKDGTITNYIAIKQDITDKKKTGSELILLSEAVGSISEIVIITDTLNNILFVNNAVELKTGYKINTLLGKEISSFFSRGLSEEIATSFVPFDKTQVWVGTTNFICFDQSELPALINCAGMFDEQNRLYGFVYTVTDISQIKKTENELHESELKYRSLFENSTIGIYRSNNNGNILVANSRFLQILGLTSLEELKGIEVGQQFYLNPETRNKFREILYNEGNVYGFESKLKKNDGSTIYIKESATAFFDETGKLDHYEGTVEDITDNILAKKEIQKQAVILKALRQSSEMFLRSTDWKSNIHSAIAEIGKAFEVCKVHVFEKELSKSNEVNFKFLAIWNNSSAKSYFKVNDVLNLKEHGLLRWDKKLSKNIIINSAEIELPKNEMKFLAAIDVKSIIVVPILLDGNFWGGISFQQCDYSRSWNNNEIEALRAAAETFSAAIKRNVYENELIVAKREAENADRTKSEFLAQISHEIRTPLNNITSFNSLIKEQLKDNIGDDILECFNVIDKASNRLIRTIGLILNLSELHTGSYKANFSNFDVFTEILEKIYLENRFSAKKRNIDFILTNNASSTIVQADKYSLDQILTNLIDNSLKYTVQGNIKINMKNDNNGQIIITISDTGIGISDDYLPNIFKSFSQEDNGYTRKYDGNGIGLSLVKEYCDLNDISIEVESKKNMGTIFTLTLKNQPAN